MNIDYKLKFIEDVLLEEKTPKYCLSIHPNMHNTTE